MERYSGTCGKMQIVRRRVGNQIREECEGMSHSADALWHVSFKFQAARPSASHQEPFLRVRSCLVQARGLSIRTLLFG